jgi:hypothetical protein
MPLVNLLQWSSPWASGAVIGEGMLNLLRVSRSGFPDLILMFYVPTKVLGCQLAVLIS